MKKALLLFTKKVELFYGRSYNKLVFLFGLIVGIWSIFYYYRYGLITLQIDQVAHLNIARQAIDSLTPGVSQLGSWPPFIHIVIAPFAQNDFLWKSGLAGSIPVVICFAVAALFLYKSALLISKSHIISIIAFLLFSLNPNILELAVSPMMEVPFYMFFILTFYYFFRWLEQEKLSFLVTSAFFSTMAELTRFEGFIFPFAIGGFIVFKYLILRRSFKHLEATLVVFLFLGLFGILVNLSYNWIFQGNPLAFVQGEWSAYAHQHIPDVLRPSEHNLGNTLAYYGQAVINNIGLPLVILSIISFPVILLGERRNINYLFLFFLLTVPIFHLISLYRGNILIYVKELPPFFIKDPRYGLSFVFFSSLMPAVAFGLLLRSRSVWKPIKTLSVIIVMLVTLVYSANNLAIGSIDQNNYNLLYSLERDNDFFEAVELLKANYDGGKILITRAGNDIFVNTLGIDISNLIQESNDIFWKKALEAPWLYARYIVMYNPENKSWAKNFDQAGKTLFNREEMHPFYDTLVDNDRYRILKVNGDAVREYAWKNTLNIKEIPSINISLVKWDPNLQEKKIKFAKANTPDDLTPRIMLSMAWEKYREKYISIQGQVVTQNTEHPTTSEGQAYALLRAVMMNDRSTFQKVLDWTEKNLRVNETQEASKSAAAKDSKNEGLKKHLFSWLWGKKSNGDYGIKDAGNATDADEDIALALLFAYRKWGNLDYLNQAKIIINDIWEYETIDVKGKRYVVAGDWAGKKGNKVYTINPSYLAPYAYRIFAEVDTQHDWNGLVDTSYEILNKCSESTFNLSSSAGIPSDWCAIDKNGKVVIANNISDKSTDYSYDAIRTLWRVALDYQWNKEPRALSYLQQMGLWQKEWSKQQKIYASYSHDGTPLQDAESLAHYGTQLAFFSITNPDVANQIYIQKVLSQWNKDGFWGDRNNYYDQNWAWFGTALYTNNLPNLWKTK